MHRARDADAADFGETFQTRRDVDAITQQIAVALDHIPDGNADAKLHLAAGRIGHVAGSQAFLNIDRATHRLHRARKLGEHRIASGVEDPPSRLDDEVVGHRAIGRQPPQRFFLVLGDQSAVAGNIGCKNRRDLAFHDDQPPAPMDRPENAATREQAQPRLRERSIGSLARTDMGLMIDAGSTCRRNLGP